MGSLLNSMRQLSGKYPIYTFQRVRTCARFIGMDPPISVKTMIKNIASPPSVLDYKLYLELHPNVRDAITWQHDGQVIPYEYWGSHQTTNVLQQNEQMIPLKEWGENKAISIFDTCNYVLATFYDSISRGLSVPYEFNADPNQDVAPVPGVAPGAYNPFTFPGRYWFSEFDALQIYLAHVAQSLWVEMTRKVPWHLHDFSDSDLALLLGSTSMFQETMPADFAGTDLEGSKGLYKINEDISGSGTPGDPTKSFRFLTGTGKDIRLGHSMIKNTIRIRETIFELFRWFRDHISHYSGHGGEEGLTFYGYGGLAPIEKMFSPYNHAWEGCHGAAALAVWVMRTVNIPCRGYYTYLDDSGHSIHHGIDFPTEQLFSPHLDDFYNPNDESTYMLDPTIEPVEVFERREDYAGSKQQYPTVPTGETRLKTYWRAVYHKSLSHPCYNWVRIYWVDLIDGGNSLDYALTHHGSLNDFPFSQSDLPALHEQYAGRLQAAVDAYIQKNGLENEPLLQAWIDYRNEYHRWYINRSYERDD